MIIQLPPELFADWLAQALAQYEQPGMIASFVADKAVEWAADQELETCCDAIYKHENQPLSGGTAKWLRAARRPKPKPPSLKDQALTEFEHVERLLRERGIMPSGCIRRAIESIPDADSCG